jgi:cation:H+ antiporter
MLLAAATILVGFIVLIWSADLFVAGAASIAQNRGISPVLIGLTIVSLGTSAPEVLVSITAALSDAGSLAIGNAIGSNIANIALVLGVTVLVAPLMIQQECMKTEIPVLLVATFGVGILMYDGFLSALDGWLMFTALALIIGLMVHNQLRDEDLKLEADDEPMPDMPPLRAGLSFLIGLSLLIASSRMLVWGAVLAAQELGVSELVIGLTIVAVGTSLPELAATIASALRGHTEIALGNIVGSNLFNLLAVTAIPGIVSTQVLEPSVGSRDYPVMAFLTVFLAVAIYVSRKRSKSSNGHTYLGRTLGAMLVSFYALYYYLLHLTTQL